MDDRALLSAYAKARAAGSAGAAGMAADGYAAALALSPDNEVLAARALSQAMAAGNQALALRAARILENKGMVAPDARLLLLAEALRTKDWRAADRHIAQIQKDEVFAFMTPVLRAWVAHGTKKGDPLAIIAAAKADPLAGGYSAEHRPLLLLASGRKEGVPELLQVSEGASGRATRLRIAGAATIAKRDRQAALALLQGDAPPLAAARQLLESGKAIPGAISTAPAGVAELLVRIALDLHAQKISQLALSYARLATFLAPENSETWLVTSELLAGQDQQQEAIRVLANIRPDDPFAGTAADARVRLLVLAGSKDAALAEAEGATRAPGATVGTWSRLGDIYTELARHEDAARAYGQALEALKQGGTGQAEWALWLLRGGALEQADKWAEAKAALQQAYKLAPDQPLVLNYLGYAQLERRENIEEAMSLITKASTLQPDNSAITDSLGWAHYLRGNLRSAIELLEKAAAGEPADPAINEHLGDAYYSAGRRFEARYAWEAALLNAEEADASRIRTKIETGLTPKLAAP